MRRYAFRWLMLVSTLPMLGGCMSSCADKGDDDDDDDDFVVGECDAGDAAFVRTSTLAVLGRRTFGQYEVSEILDSASGAPDDSARRSAILDAVFANEDEYVDRWTEAIMDHLRVPRMDDQAMNACYGVRSRSDDSGQLAEYARDNLASDPGDGNGAFTMRDMLASAIRADDLSPIYRGHLFAMLSRPIPAANVLDPAVAELARRQDFGYLFDATYLNRDLVCLGCHNSEFSVTDDAGDQDRHWPLPGLLEKAVYGASTGVNPDNAHAMFRCQDFSFDEFFGCTPSGPTVAPWGWNTDCGQFSPDPPPDLAGVSVTFATLQGDTSTVFDLEAALKRGVDVLATDGLVLAGDGTPVDSEAAFAYLLAMSISEMAWEEIVGSPLTIANYFPRNQAQRDELKRITDAFVASHFSLRTLVTAILGSPYVNQKAPVDGCGTGAHVMPAIYDPWTLGEATEELRNNSPADGVAALPPLVLTRAAHSAMEWPVDEYRMFPQTGADVVFLRGTGVFLKNGEPGFKGLDFQARLVWEARYAPCDAGVPDFVTGLVADAGAATVRDVVVALKDRLVNEASIDETPAASGGSGEAEAIEALFGASLDDPTSAVADLEGSTRQLCGALLSSPQFLLGGLADPTNGPVPLLNSGP